MDINDYHKWAGMPKFKVWRIEVSDQPAMMQIRYGHLNTNEVVNVCFQIQENVDELVIKVEDALNTLMKSFYLPQKKGIDHAAS
jgi:hypothetical protein